MSQSQPTQTLHQFVAAVRAKLNRHWLATALAGGAVVASGGMVGVALGYILAGYRPDVRWYFAPAAVGALVAAGLYLLRRVDEGRAAAYADQHFSLTDALVSALGFERTARSGGVYQLQASQAADGVAGKRAADLRLPPPWWLAIIAAVLLGTSGYLSTFADSPEVQDRRQQVRISRDRSGAAADELKAQLREMMDEMSDDERQMLDRSGLREMVEKLGPEDDARAALAELAKIERKARELPMREMVKNDRKYLSKAAEQLKQGRQDKALAKALEEQRYRDAARELEKLKLEPQDPADKGEDKQAQSRPAQDATSRPTNADAEAARRLEQLAQRGQRLRKSTDQMKAAAEQMGQLDSEAMELAQQLAESAQQCDSQLSEACEQCSGGSLSERELAQLGEQTGQTDGDLVELADALEELEARQAFIRKLDEMLKTVGECQGYVAGQCQLPSNRNGKGVGSSDHGAIADRQASRDPRGQDARLTGQKGSGPSRVTIVDAASGSGARTLSGRARQEEFRRQVESLVRREDVPPSLKSGVKEYLERIHDLPPAEPAPGDVDGQESP